jgi:hypothetical protein
MSRQNKVNPGMYTQRGRLTQDDAARELKRMRNVGSPHTWQPVQRDRKPPFTAEPAADHDQSAETAEETPAAIEKVPARAKAAKPAAAKAATTPKRSATSQSRRPAKTAARKTAGAKKATTATKRGKVGRAKPAKAAKAATNSRAKSKAKSATKSKAKGVRRRG